MSARALIVGLGSIGARHARLLAEAGCRVEAVTSRGASDAGMAVHAGLGPALDRFGPDYVVVANQTDRHHATLAALAKSGFDGKVLVEKPVFDRVLPVPAHRFARLAVAYNLRFHPVMEALFAEIRDEKLVSVHSFVGQYLPDWRPGRDYRTTYSADAAQSGGVLLDLSHDIDLAMRLAGPWTRATGIGGTLGGLEITSEDSFSILSRHARCPVVTISLNYLDRRTRRTLLVQTRDRTLEADFIAGTLTVDRDVVDYAGGDRNESYRRMHGAMLGDGAGLCDIDEALAVLSLIDRVRDSSFEWSERE